MSATETTIEDCFEYEDGVVVYTGEVPADILNAVEQTREERLREILCEPSE